MARDSQKIKKNTKTPRITEEGWNSQKQLSDPVKKKMKEDERKRKEEKRMREDERRQKI